MDAINAAVWQLVFRHLCLRDLASCCKSCPKLAAAAHAFVSLRRNDACNGLEKHAVRFVNWVSSIPYAEIGYVSENISSSGMTVREAYGSVVPGAGCKCIVSTDKVVQGVNRERTVCNAKKGPREGGLVSGLNLSLLGDPPGESSRSPLDKETLMSDGGRLQACQVDSCTCGIDLQNEIAYDQNGLLLALLEDDPDSGSEDGPKPVPQSFPLAPGTCKHQGHLTDNLEVCCDDFGPRYEPPSKKQKGKRTIDTALVKSIVPESRARSQPSLGPKGLAPEEAFGNSQEVEGFDSAVGRCTEDLSRAMKGEHESFNRLRLPRAPEALSLVVFECGPACKCSLKCNNRVTQRGLSVKVKVIRHSKKGWCLHAEEDIQQGAFICQYAGELLTNSEAGRRHQIYDSPDSRSNSLPAPALLVVREHLPSNTASLRLNIDATVLGNVARFINHSCDGGNVTRVLVRQIGWPLPHVALFANRRITNGEEITMSYGTVEGVNRTSEGAPVCFCGTAACRGVMPRDLVGV